ncbi:beta strand repeat-containing protein [Spirosoma validum]|uniref:Immunoglobulin domain-containing protein n=1 Tax=Spirosoma validum TaxID=2771355 RepID=A0A927B5A4_9BACT|nr:immunoglobulin domain-containing protein [Spirosoma validum]MBD2755915.1 immunoglobulin domain-containing protein [Spirosoma validum]
MTNNYLFFNRLIPQSGVSKKPLATKQLVTCLLFTLISLWAKANTYNVNTTADGNSSSGTVNLRGAILAADALGGTHTINVPAGTYNLTLGTVTFGNKAQNITINGAGAGSTIINMTATNRDRIFFINPTAFVYNVQTTITGVSFTNGHLTSDNYGGGAIIAGGPNNALTITSCGFTNNTIDASRASAGGAIAYLGGGYLAIDQCTFTTNSAPSNANANGAGGAVDFEAYSFSINNVYTYPDNSLSVTNSVFTNNSVGNNGIGGAINVSAGGFSTVDPPRPTLSITIAENSFVNNSAPGSGGNGRGGAISATNSFSPTNVFRINYNRFVGNTANVSAGSALISFDTQGSVDASNNWWGCNGGPTSCADKAYRYPGSSSGTLTTTPYLQLRTTAASSPLCSGNSTGITAGFTVNSAGTAIAASNLSAFTGVPITFNTTLGTMSSAQTTIQATGTATATFTAGTTPGSGTVNAVVDNVPANDATARASITVNAAPVITDQPDNATTCSGTTVSFNAAATGSGTLSYQWYKGTTALANGATGTGSTLSGATTATLTIINPGSADAATNYNLRVSSTAGCSVTATNASLVVNIPPAISSQPANTSGCAGNTVSFGVTANGSGTLSYQWYKGTTALANGATGTGSSIGGATTASLSISNASPTDNASNYNVRISSSTGCTPTTSTNASLVVIAPPVISSQPVSGSSVQVGGSVRVVVSVSGQVTSYQWYREGAIISGQTSATLNLTNLQLSQAGSYSLVASNGCGSVTSGVFSLTVLGSDLSPIIYARPTIVYGNSPFTVVVDVLELNSVATSGTFTVRVTKDQKLNLSFDPGLSSVNNRSVQNSVWSLDNSNLNYYILTTSQSIAAGDKLSFGLTGSLLPSASTGVVTVSATVLPTTVVEAKLNNNIDADKIEYFQQ